MIMTHRSLGLKTCSSNDSVGWILRSPLFISISHESEMETFQDICLCQTDTLFCSSLSFCVLYKAFFLALLLTWPRLALCTCIVWAFIVNENGQSRGQNYLRKQVAHLMCQKPKVFIVVLSSHTWRQSHRREEMQYHFNMGILLHNFWRPLLKSIDWVALSWKGWKLFFSQLCTADQSWVEVDFNATYSDLANLRYCCKSHCNNAVFFKRNQRVIVSLSSNHSPAI